MNNDYFICMESINCFERQIYSYLSNKFYYLFDTSVRFYTDDSKFIKFTDERLSFHFSSICDCNNVLKVYSLSHKMGNQLIKIVNPTSSSYEWKHVEHMGGCFFTTCISNNYTLTFLATKPHVRFKDCSLSVSELIYYFLNGFEHTCMVANFEQKRIFFIYNNVDDYTQLVPMRIIRSLMMRSLLKNQYVYFHAAAISYRNKGILLTGASGKGKTSTLLHFMNNKHGFLIANDKVFIGVDMKKGPIVYGWPTVVTLGVGSLNQYDQLKRYLTNIDDVSCVQDLYGYTPKDDYLHMTKEQMKNLERNRNKLVISHRHLSEIFHMSIVPFEKISAIVNIKLEWMSRCRTLKRLENESKRNILYTNIIDNISDQMEWMGYPILTNKIIHNPIFSRIIKTTNFYEFQGDFSDPNLSDFLDEVVK